MNKKILALIIAISLVLLLGYLFQSFTAEEPSSVIIFDTAPEGESNKIVREAYKPLTSGEYRDEPYNEEDPVVGAPASLEGSDVQVKEAVLDLAPAMASWLLPEEQVRKWVLLVDLVAEGKLPRRYRPLNYPMASFKVDESRGEVIADPANFERANILLDQVIAIEPARLARYYRQWQPLLEKAYRELGKPGSFDQRLHRAIERALAVKPLQEQAGFKHPGVFYLYADSKLEKSSDLSRLMWRLGEDNTLRLQVYLQKLLGELDANE
jgi:hypothetical protein